MSGSIRSRRSPRSATSSASTPRSRTRPADVGAACFAAAKPRLVLVNTARGAIVDLDALPSAYIRQLAGAALDVLLKEPVDPAHPLIGAWRAREPWLDGRLMLTPHAAFYSPASLIDLRENRSRRWSTYLREGRLTNCVNQEFLTQATM